jgi:hypothetical protein
VVDLRVKVDLRDATFAGYWLKSLGLELNVNHRLVGQGLDQELLV